MTEHNGVTQVEAQIRKELAELRAFGQEILAEMRAMPNNGHQLSQVTSTGIFIVSI